MRTFKTLTILALAGVLAQAKQANNKNLVQEKAFLEQNEIILDIVVDDACCSANPNGN
jgi:hypothetical protein